MADKKVSELTAITNLSRDDLLLVVNDPSGTPASRKITHANFFGNVVSETVHAGSVTFNANTTVAGTKQTVSANSTFNGSVTYNGSITFNQGAVFSNTTVNVFNSNTIVNGTLTTNGAISLASSVLAAGGVNIIGSNGRINANNAINPGSITEAMMQTKPIANTTARTLIADRMQVANTQALHTSITANLNSYIANTNPRITNLLSSVSSTNTNLRTLVTSTNTALRTLISDRMQVANTTLLVNDRMQVANVNALIANSTVYVSQVRTTNQETISTLRVNGSDSTSGVLISDGSVLIFSNTGAPAYTDYYCEFLNNHRVRVQAPTHTAILGDAAGNTVLTLPTRSGNVATTNSETFTGTTNTENLNVNDVFRITTKVSDFATSNAQTESVTAGSIYYSNTYLYVVTDSNTIKRVLLSTW